VQSVGAPLRPRTNDPEAALQNFAGVRHTRGGCQFRAPRTSQVVGRRPASSAAALRAGLGASHLDRYGPALGAAPSWRWKRAAWPWPIILPRFDTQRHGVHAAFGGFHQPDYAPACYRLGRRAWAPHRRGLDEVPTARRRAWWTRCPTAPKCTPPCRCSGGRGRK